MRHLLSILPLAVVLGACGSGGTGPAGGDARRSFPATGFDRVNLAGPDDVDVRVGPAFAVAAEAEQEVLEKLVVEVADGELRVTREGRVSRWLGWFRGRDRRALVRITLPVVRGVTVSGAGSATVTGAAAPVFVGAVEGAGNLRLSGLDTRNAAFKLSGAGNLDLAGRTGDMTVTVTGAGNVSADRLEARDVDVQLSGVGNVEVRATGRAKVRVSGVGNVEVAGTRDCQVTRSGLGDVTCTG